MKRKKKSKVQKLKIITALFTAVLLLMIAIVIFLETKTREGQLNNAESSQLVTVTEPWDEPGTKQPQDYTWSEFLALPPEQQIAFQKAFESYEAFESWMNSAQPAETEKPGTYPWAEPGAKQPEEYTWEEFKALTGDQQIEFQSYMGAEGFEAWLTQVQGETAVNPWDEPGAKQPEEYTWEEFEALTEGQQMAFQDCLGMDAFEVWLNRVQKQMEKNPWDEAGAKQPEDYTWEEFEALTGAQQMAFQNFLGAEGFEDWLNSVQEKSEENPWDEPGAKQPEDYTWEEFEALTGEQQMAFQDYLGDAGFEAWLNKVQPQNPSGDNPWDEPGAKQPADYTWAEFEALTASQQMAFQSYLGEADFEAWLNKVQGQEQPEANPWEKPGAKQPEDYTWEEFEALTAAQQMAFQDYLGEEGFDAWLNRVLGL